MVPGGKAGKPRSSKWQGQLLTGDKGNVKACLANVELILTHHDAWRGVARFNQFAGQVMATKAPPDCSDECTYPRPWSSEDDTRAAIWIQRKFGCVVSSVLVTEAINVVAQRDGYHPIREELRAVQWDGERRLDTWLTDCLGVERTPYSEAVGAMWLISSVARIEKPGCKADHVLVLEGEQGRGKSTALKILAGEEYFSDQVEDFGSKDAAMQLKERRIVEMSELVELSRGKQEQAKAFLTRTHDRFRPPYGRRVVEVPRQCVFAGSTNASTYLADATGARRIWAVKVGTIDLERLAAVRDQLWAEAFVDYTGGRRWWPDAAQLESFRAEQEQRFQVDAWEALLADWLESRTTTNAITTGALLQQAVGKDPGAWTRADEMRIANSMKRLGYDQERRMLDGKRVRFWVQVGQDG